MYPYAIAIFEDKLYWSDWHTRSIESCNKFTGKEHHTIVREQHELVIYGIHLFHPVLHQRIDNPCSLAFCSDICLLSGTTGYTCSCPQDKILSADKHTCKGKECVLFVTRIYEIVQVYDNFLLSYLYYICNGNINIS